MKTLLTTFALLFTVITINAQDTISLSDFESMNNTSWEGTLTYKDYQSGKQETVDATMQFKIEGDKLISNVQYTYEPSKNHKGSVKIKKNGTYFGNEKVLSFKEENGTKTLVTTYQSRDNGKKADMFITHTLTDSTYTVTKEVSYLDSDEKFVRNTYSYTKL
ncbi:hypothetical protein DFQ05_0644 [Winogradskyella wandonensis]|uniref:Lipocalin-like protein n=1 Tax=Winogradskyella wandonensis TaxID=1442586 RepID=A0A4R1KY36_9FLAO|nr:hypothetical protein [Winogradskyella wandonensis]TCK69129.1 hypothetical protein DFQ05_0644 [Winogradskyella wandonensis]